MNGIDSFQPSEEFTIKGHKKITTRSRPDSKAAFPAFCGKCLLTASGPSENHVRRTNPEMHHSRHPEGSVTGGSSDLLSWSPFVHAESQTVA